MTHPPNKFKTSISLDSDVMKMAQARQDECSYPSFSAYLETLIQHDFHFGGPHLIVRQGGNVTYRIACRKDEDGAADCDTD